VRFKNIAAFALGKMDAWGLNNESMTQDTWDYVILRRGIFCRSPAESGRGAEVGS